MSRPLLPKSVLSRPRTCRDYWMQTSNKGTGSTPAKKIKLDEKATLDGNKKRKGGRRTLPKKDSTKSADDSDDGEEEQEDCSAKPKCLKPVGKDIHWVQCDGCELWLHLNCIGKQIFQFKTLPLDGNHLKVS